MTKTLIIAEKPSVARDIAAAIGGCKKVDDWMESDSLVISSGIGHLVELDVPEANVSGKTLETLPVIPERFSLQAIDKTKKQFNLLVKLMKRADVTQVVNACDAGREGELIFRLIYELAGCQKPMKRMWLQSMTADAIRDAYRNMQPGQKYDALSNAAKCRSEADWLIGINGSRGVTQLQTLQIGRFEMMSAGRVQTPTLAIIVDRENEIKHFVPKGYWEVHATFKAQAGFYVGKWINTQDQASDAEEGSRYRLFDQNRADQLVALCTGKDPSSVTDESKNISSAPPQLFDLTTLQREANKRYKFSAKKTLDLAQSLYEKHKVISYPRTDSSCLPEDYMGKTIGILEQLNNTNYACHSKRVLENGWVKPSKRIFNNAKISDHFAIIPTGKAPASLDEAEAKIYDLVARRFIAAFHPAAEYKQTIRTSMIAGESFRTTGKVLVNPGWLVVYDQAEEDAEQEATLCPIAPNEQVKTLKVEAKHGKTKPPSRFTEAALLSAMESAGKLVDDDALKDAMKDKGLGTPATRAAIIEGLLSKGSSSKPKEPYIVREGKAQHLVPTEKGIGLIAFLNSNGVQVLTSPKLTGDWEHKLRLIEQGQYTRPAFMSEIADMTHQIINTIKSKASALPSAAASSPSKQVSGRVFHHPCPKCGGQLLANGRVLQCQCDFTLWQEVCKKVLADTQLTQLLTQEKTELIDGFVSKAGKLFSAMLKLNRSSWKVEFEFAAKPTTSVQPAQPLHQDIPLICPKCGSQVMQHEKLYSCVKGDFKLWRVVSQRELKPNEVAMLINNRRLPTTAGFVNKAGKPFSAALKMADDFSQVTFEFE